VRSLETMGARVTVSSLPHCAFDTGLESGIDIPGFKGRLPDGVFVRSISAGTLEQITFRLGLLHALRESGVRVWNDARAIERCVDKSQTTFCCTSTASRRPERASAKRFPMRFLNIPKVSIARWS
jgi:hypothetical protein